MEPLIVDRIISWQLIPLQMPMKSSTEGFLGRGMQEHCNGPSRDVAEAPEDIKPDLKPSPEVVAVRMEITGCHYSPSLHHDARRPTLDMQDSTNSMDIPIH
jgi:hypothetical protein